MKVKLTNLVVGSWRKKNQTRRRYLELCVVLLRHTKHRTEQWGTSSPHGRTAKQCCSPILIFFSRPSLIIMWMWTQLRFLKVSCQWFFSNTQAGQDLHAFYPGTGKCCLLVAFSTTGSPLLPSFHRYMYCLPYAVANTV